MGSPSISSSASQFFTGWTPPSPIGAGGLIGSETRVAAISFSEEQIRANELITGGGYTVFYYLKPCRGQEEGQDTNCLWRYVSSDISPLSNGWDTRLENEEQKGRVLLKNVKTFQITYLNIFDGQWNTQWPVTSQTDIVLPAVIKIFLEFQDRRKKWVREQIVIPIYQRYLSLRMVRS